MTPAERQKQQVSYLKSGAGQCWTCCEQRQLADIEMLQLDRLLKDPTKMVHIPAGPVEKTLRPPREMMKNVTGSSAGVSGHA